VHTAGPVHLVHLFGLSKNTSVSYVGTAHPERFAIDSAQA
jgi:hypothetical protein